MVQCEIERSRSQMLAFVNGKALKDLKQMIFPFYARKTAQKRKRAPGRLAARCNVEELEQRCLLTATVLNELDHTFAAWADGFGNEPGYSYDTEWEAGSYQLRGSIQWNDADYIYFPMAPGDTVELTASAPAPFWMVAPGSESGTQAWTETFAGAEVNGEDVGIQTSDNQEGLEDASANSHAEVGPASASAAASVHMTSSLLAGYASAHASTAVTGQVSWPRAEARAGAQGVFTYLTNRSGALNVTDDVGGWVIRNDAGDLYYQIGIGAFAWLISPEPNSEYSSASGSWIFTQDEFTPTAAIVDYDGNILAESDSMGYLKYTQSSLAAGYLVVAHDRQYNGTIDQRYDRDFVREYQVDIDLTKAEVHLAVSAQFDELNDADLAAPADLQVDGIQVSSDKFGPYLPNVYLPNKFTVAIDGTGSDFVRSVRWELGTHHGDATRVANTHNWTFTTDMGDYTSGTRDLIVSAFDSNSVLMEEYHADVVHLANLNFELQVDPGTSDPLINVEDARFFTSIPANLTFQGTVDKLATFYHDKTQVYVGNSPVSVQYAAASAGILTKFTFSYDAGLLSPGPTGTIGVDVEINHRSIQEYGDDKEPLRAVPKPTWLNGGSIAYNTADGEYKFHNFKPQLLDYSASIAKTGVKWLDSQLKKIGTSYVRLEAVLNIDAALQKAESPDYQASQLIGHAQVLGQQVPDKVSSSSTLVFTGSLDSLTLDPTGWGVHFSHPQPLANQTFLNTSLSFDPVAKATGIPKWLASAEFNLALKLIGTLEYNAGILLTKGTSGVAYVSSGTYLTLSAIPEAQLHIDVHGDVLNGFLADLAGSFDATARLELSASAHFSGAISAAPKIESVQFSAKFSMSYRIRVIGTLAKGAVRVVDYDSASPENGGPDDDVFGPKELLTLSNKKHPK